MQRTMSYLWLAIFMMAFLMTGCNWDVTSPADADQQSVNESTVNEKSDQSIDSYPRQCFSLNVPFLPQVPPGTWAETKNCGQACAVMLAGYFNGAVVNSARITAQNSWLANFTRDQRYNQANGWYTGGNALNAYRALLGQYNGLQISVGNGSTPEDVVNQAVRGRPCIVGVMINGGRLVSDGGIAHWALVVGWDGRNIILNDPGTNSGNHIAYSVAAFNASWATQGKIYISVWR